VKPQKGHGMGGPPLGEVCELTGESIAHLAVLCTKFRGANCEWETAAGGTASVVDWARLASGRATAPDSPNQPPRR
jgi:hypothetical protein